LLHYNLLKKTFEAQFGCFKIQKSYTLEAQKYIPDAKVSQVLDLISKLFILECLQVSLFLTKRKKMTFMKYVNSKHIRV
jgi:hypothetical protein